MDIVERLKSFAFVLANRLDREGAILTTDGAIEITRLRAEIDAAHVEKLEAKVKMTEAMIEARDLRARLAEAEAVIKPFADKAETYSKSDADELWCNMRLLYLRAAARWMESKADTTDKLHKAKANA